MLLLAQLVAPPIQPGPVRLPNNAPQQRPKDEGPLFDEPAEAAPQPPTTPATTDREQSGAQTLDWRPTIVGKTPYDDAQLQAILKDCGKASVNATLNA